MLRSRPFTKELRRLHVRRGRYDRYDGQDQCRHIIVNHVLTRSRRDERLRGYDNIQFLRKLSDDTFTLGLRQVTIECLEENPRVVKCSGDFHSGIFGTHKARHRILQRQADESMYHLPHA